MATTVTLAGSAVTPDHGTLTIEAFHDARHLCRFRLQDPTGTITVEHDQELIVADGGVRSFGGLVDEVGREAFAEKTGGVTAVRHRITAVDFRARCDQRIVNETYAAGTTLKAILTDLRTKYLDVFGITMDAGMADGPALTEAVTFVNVTLTAASNKLTTITGWPWTVSYTKVYGAYEPGTVSAPFAITATDTHCLSLRWTQPRTAFRNREYLQFGSAGARDVDDQWTATAGQTDFPLHYTSITGYRAVNEDGTWWNVGVYGVDALRWTYDPATTTLYYDGPAFAGGEVITFNLGVMFPQTAMAEDPSAATNPWETVDSAPECFDYFQASVDAAAQLRRFGGASIPKRVSIVTDEGGLAPLQSLPITLPGYALSGDYLVVSVIGRHIPDTKEWMRYEVECVEGTELPESFQEFWRGGGVTGGSLVGGSGGSGGVSSVSRLHAHLGGDDTLYAAATWQDIGPGDPEFVAPVSGSYTSRARVKTEHASAGVQVRLYDRTASAEVAGSLTAAETATAWADALATVVLVAGHRYRAQILGGTETYRTSCGVATVELT